MFIQSPGKKRKTKTSEIKSLIILENYPDEPPKHTCGVCRLVIASGEKCPYCNTLNENVSMGANSGDPQFDKGTTNQVNTTHVLDLTCVGK